MHHDVEIGDREAYQRFLSLHVVVAMGFEIKVNPTSSVAKSFGVECQVDGTLTGVYDGTSDFQSGETCTKQSRGCKSQLSLTRSFFFVCPLESSLSLP